MFEEQTSPKGEGQHARSKSSGAPFVDGAALAGTMNREGLPGVIFTAACFTPYASKHKGEPCEGVLLHVSDAHAFRPVRTGVTLLYRIREMWPRQFRWIPRDGKPRRFISLLAGCGAFEDEPPAPEALLRHGSRTAPLFTAQGGISSLQIKQEGYRWTYGNRSGRDW
ncbi:MAG: hypothetical protein V8T36_03715 [Ruthenibacterium lactatiformans]